MTPHPPQPWRDGLSSAARSAWAKHHHDSGLWLPLYRHMADSAAVAGKLFDEWLPERLRGNIGAALPEGVADARRLATWLAAVHDIGKATPAFACQVDELADEMRGHGLDMPLKKQIHERSAAPHGLAGQFLLREWLVERHGWRTRATPQFTVVVGGHHGVPPNLDGISSLERRPDLLRTPGSEQVWQGVQHELLGTAARLTGAIDRLRDWHGTKLPQTAQVLLSGLVIVADWIASNPDYFPYFPGERNTDPERTETAWRLLDLPWQWRPVEPDHTPEELFAARFSLPANATLRPVQCQAVEAARELPKPGLMIVEAPMGEGKTEAALAVAEIFAAGSGAGGCLVALPTMATSNAMFDRFLHWLRRLPGMPEQAASVFLAHSKAHLNEDFTRLMGGGAHLAADTDRDAEDEGTANALIAHRWLRGRKKGLLSSFAVGTVDQLLFTGLRSRHLALRHLALAGKVVVIDEAHAYDTYMNTYLDRALDWLGRYGVPVVVLSATLPAGRRRELVRAYTGSAATDADLAPVEDTRAYPLIVTAGPGSTPRVHTPAASGRATDVSVEALDDDLESLAERLKYELADGGCALVVRNTVARVHETATHLRGHFDAAEITVAHSRFLDLDRATKDRGLIADFGPPDKVTELGGARPTRHVVVASQVVEQSLDVDFDLLVTDLAPTDLVLQRMGRLHRHPRGENQSERPARLRTARCLITGVDWAQTPPTPVKGSRTIYGTYPLLRALAALNVRPSTDTEPPRTVRLPDDISTLVQDAYGPDEHAPDTWREALDHARADHEITRADKSEKARTFLLASAARDGRSLIGWVDAGVGDAEDTAVGKAQVRDTGESLEVLVARRSPDGTVTTVPWLPDGRGGLPLPLDIAPDPAALRVLAASGLRLPYQFTITGQMLDRTIEELEADAVPAWQDKQAHWVAGELVLFLDEDDRAELAGHTLHYTQTDGLEVSRAE